MINLESKSIEYIDISLVIRKKMYVGLNVNWEATYTFLKVVQFAWNDTCVTIPQYEASRIEAKIRSILQLSLRLLEKRDTPYVACEMQRGSELHAARIAATPPRGIKHSICILLFNISLCYPQPSARGRHVTHCCHGTWCTTAAAMCLLSVGADLSPFTNDRTGNYNFGKSKRIVYYNELLCREKKGI